MNTLTVNLFAGPGVGKSTIAAAVFSELKWMGVDCELVREYAKDLVWEKRTKTFEDQIYLFGKQHYRLFSVIGQVKIVITDSPIILAIIYDEEKRDSLLKLVMEEHHKCYNMNILLEREKPYNPNGRNQTEEEAIKVDKKIKTFLDEEGICYYNIKGNSSAVKQIVDLVCSNCCF